MLDGTDIVLIHQLLARYGHAIDQRDWAAFTELFVEDSSIDYRGGTGDVVRNGRDAVVQWFVEVDSRHPAAHHVTNIVVDEHADPDGRVAVHSKFIAPYTREAHHPKRLSGGDYRDVVVRTPSGWRFQHKQCIVRWNVAVRVEVDDVPEHRRTY